MISNQKKEFLFVYGTLLSHYHQNPFKIHFQENLIFISSAKIQGQLFLVDNYPAWIPNSLSGEWVYGEVFEMLHPNITLGLLDQYESFDESDPKKSEYLRIKQKVILTPNEVLVDSWIYQYNFTPNNLKKIENGKFLNFNIVNNF